MGMILGHHIPPPLGFPPPKDSCGLSLKFDGPGPSPFLRFRYDWFWKPDGTRVFIKQGVGDNHPAFDNYWQYDVSPPWNLNVAGWTLTHSVQIGTDTFGRTMELAADGTFLTFVDRWFAGFRRIHSSALLVPWDLSGGFGAGTAFTGLIGNEFAHHWSLDYGPGEPAGKYVMIDRLAGEYHRYEATTPGDAGTLQPFDQTWDSRIDAGSRSESDIAVSPDGLKVFSVANASPSKRLCSWDLTAPFDFSAPFNFTTGPDINLPTNFGIARGINYRADTGDILMEQDQNTARIRCWSQGAIATTDPAFNDVVLLLDFDGPDGGTNITDLSDSGHTETFFGNAQIDTSQRFLGRNSLLLDGTGDYVTFPDSADWDFPGDLTIEFGVNLDVIGVAQTFMGNYLTGAGDDKGISVEIDASNNLRVLNGDSVLYSEAWAVAINTDYFLAVARSGTDLRVFVDGVQLGATVVDSTNFVGSVQPWRLGSLDGSSQFVDGHLGAVRITNGVGRYTSGYPLPGCFYPHDPVPASPVTASGAPSITKPTSAGAAVVTSLAAMEAGAPVIGTSGSLQTIPASPSESIDDRLFVYSNNAAGPIVDGTWTALATAPGNMTIHTKIAAGDITDLAQVPATVFPHLAHYVYIKFTMKQIAGAGWWDFNAQSTLRHTNRNAFDNNSLAAFGTPAPSCSFFAGHRIATGNVANPVGDFSDAAWNAPPNGGTILKVRTFNPLPTTSTHWSAISFLCEPTKIAYATGKFWADADSPNSHLVTSRGWRYDHD